MRSTICPTMRSSMRFSIGCLLVGVAFWSCLVSSSVNANDTQVEISTYVEQYAADVKSLEHRFRIPMDPESFQRKLDVVQGWLDVLDEVAFDSLDDVGKTDYLLLKSELEYQREYIRLESERDRRAVKFLPYFEHIIKFCKDRENVEPIEPQELAGRIDDLAEQVELSAGLIEGVDSEVKDEESARKRLSALRATKLLSRFQRSISEANKFYEGYDPLYSWWMKKPIARLEAALKSHGKQLREQVVGVPESDKETIIGLPIGADGLALELRHEWIAHTPEELVALAEQEMKWCDQAMAEAARKLGFGDDWRKAMDHVKEQHVAPGKQPQMIRELAWEAIRFLESHDLVTVPPLAANGWRMTMMSPERQRVSPYFLGGDTIIVSFPTDAMTQEEKLMSMRSNNEHFSRATVHHELIPGHHLQYYMLPRYRAYRTTFRTPFWMEGWALYWEMLLWDLDFAQSAEDEVGMLFWRKHRCARIIFSLGYHLGTMSPEECIDYLVERVGHERSAATAEVRRSIMGGYSPLYQAAYMLGGLQLRAMHAEFVQTGKMSNREFHDRILHEHSIPIEVLRRYMSGNVTNSTQPNWRFAD